MQETVSLSIINLRSKRETALAVDQTFIDVQPSFNRSYESWNDKLKTRLIETILIGRAMNPIWVIQNDEDGTEEVLDGMHRLTTALHFFNNKFALSGQYISTINPEEYKNKKFCDLSQADQSKIRNYGFIINKLDSSYKTDDEKLQDMYDILNRSSIRLNDYEFKKPIYNPFYELIGPAIGRFLNTILFDHSKNSRGKLETEAMKWLALSERRLPEKFASLNDLCDKWQKRNLGETLASAKEAVNSRGEQFMDSLERIRKTMLKYVEEDLFEELQNRRKRAVEILCMITRTVALIPDNARIARHISNLCTKFKERILAVDINTILNDHSRNSGFQRKLIEYIDAIILEEIGDIASPRCFPRAMIEEKLNEQDHMCSLCKKKIRANQTYDGDHIKEWVSGGETVKENLQVVHTKCHKRKHEFTVATD
jgi:hypothetical protein